MSDYYRDPPLIRSPGSESDTETLPRYEPRLNHAQSIQTQVVRTAAPSYRTVMPAAGGRCNDQSSTTSDDNSALARFLQTQSQRQISQSVHSAPGTIAGGATGRSVTVNISAGSMQTSLLREWQSRGRPMGGSKSQQPA
ncbi:hypothetical protein HK100_009006, partial [Physocladia obscura]